MDIECMRTLKRGKRPFKLRLAGGRVVDVASPDFMALSPAGHAVLVTTTDDWLEVIRLNQIESIETPDVPTGT